MKFHILYQILFSLLFYTDTRTVVQLLIEVDIVFRRTCIRVQERWNLELPYPKDDS